MFDLRRFDGSSCAFTSFRSKLTDRELAAMDDRARRVAARVEELKQLSEKELKERARRLQQRQKERKEKAG